MLDIVESTRRHCSVLKAWPSRAGYTYGMSILRAMLPLGVLVAFWAVLAQASVAPVGDLISQRGWLDDPSGQWTLDEVRDKTLRPLNGPLGTANRHIPFWLRLVVPPQPQERQNLVLVLQPATVENLQVYTSDGQGGWAMRETGSQYAFSSRERSDLNFSLAITASTTQDTVLYVRMYTATGILHAKVLTTDEARDFDTQLHIGMGIYLGLALMFTLLSTTMWMSTREPLWGWAALFDVNTMLHSSLQVGLFAKYVMPGAPDLLPTVFAVSGASHMTVGCCVFALLVKALQAPRWAVLGYLAVTPIWVVWVVLAVAGHWATVFRQVNLWLLASSLWGIAALLSIRTPDWWLRWMYRVLTGVLIAYLMWRTLPILGAAKATNLSVYPTLPSNLVTMFMVVAILARRTLLEARARQQLQHEKQEAEQRYQLEQAHNAEVSGMLSMVMHEMKNPLASIRMASELLSSGRVQNAEDQEKRFRNIQDAVDGIDTVLQRCIEVDRLEQGALVEERQHEDVSALLRQWVIDHRQRARLHEQMPDVFPAHIDARLMFLLLGNLVDNAIKYSPPESTVSVQLKDMGTELEIEVRNAVGRAGRPDPERLFQKYYRSPRAQHGGGTGLGLYWVRTVSEMLGGSVTYQPEHEDVVFVLRMPR